MTETKNGISYDGLKSLPEVKAELNLWIAHLKQAVNNDTGHLLDVSCVISHYAKLLQGEAAGIQMLFNQQLDSVIK